MFHMTGTNHVLNQKGIKLSNHVSEENNQAEIENPFQLGMLWTTNIGASTEKSYRIGI